MPQRFNDFDPTQVTLEQRNLIQASAGTGKTYSLALLTIRLLIERPDIKINNILLVTFTNAAVAELETRVRSFVRLALKRARTEEIDDTTLSGLIDDYVFSLGREAVEHKLHEAQLMLDETSVMTIHGFCQQVLKEYAFETGQVFGSETMSPDEMNEVIQDSVNEFWRRHVTTLNPPLLRRLLSVGDPLLSNGYLLSVAKQGVQGKIPIADVAPPDNFIDEAGQLDFLAEEDRIQEEIVMERTRIVSSLNDPDVHEKIRNNRVSGPKFLPYLNEQDWEGMFDLLCDKCKEALPKFVVTWFGTEMAESIMRYAQDDRLSIIYRRYISWICIAAYEFAFKELREKLNERGSVTFGEMIRLTYEALQRGGSEKLVSAMRVKYKAAFCDEYQDTDKHQHQIFKELFYDDTILFFVGDSKQSIYAFRKADLNTFFEADQTVDRVHLMNTNHRSTEDLIKAMNQFFQPTLDFPTFAFEGNGPSIHYNPVLSPNPNRRGLMTLEGKPVVPMLVSQRENKGEIPKEVLQIILGLIHKDYKIADRKVKFSDIGILVRTNKEGRKIKSLLSAHQIPCISIDDTKIFTSNEAKEIYYILVGVYELTNSSVNRALLTGIGRATNETLLRSNQEDIMRRFRKYREVWLEDGVYEMLNMFFADHGLYDQRFDVSINGADRIIANALQLAELVHKISARKNFDMLEQIQWVKKGMDGEIREGDEYLQRLESDEQAVKIITMHKAKGLEYNIAICPYLDMNADGHWFQTGSFRDPDGEYYVMDKVLMSPDQESMYLVQSEQENRRLLYVAITRARYQCYITGSKYKDCNNSALRKFLDELKKVDLDPTLINLDWSAPTGLPRYTGTAGDSTPQYAEAMKFRLREEKWRRTSYSGLTAEHSPTPAKKYEGLSQAAYDQFIFRDLKRGAQTGNLLHYIFEKIDFADNTYWGKVIERAKKRISTAADDAMIQRMLTEVLGCDLGTGFLLKEITVADRLNELEFDFPLKRFQTGEINRLGTPEIPLMTGPIYELEGIMNGKVDLVFRKDGKYWILDWKSNWLGERPEDYRGDTLADAMKENNYHLQYHIYTLALKRFLSRAVPNFDYERDFGGCYYLFVRGVRAGSDHGVFFHKPSLDVINALEDLLCPDYRTVRDRINPVQA